MPQGYVAVSRPEAGLAPELVARAEVQVLFDGPHDVERWDVRARHGELEIDHWIYEGAPELEEGQEPLPLHEPGELYVMFCVRRRGSAFPMHRDQTLQADDIVSIAIYEPERERAEAALEVRGFIPSPSTEFEDLETSRDDS